MSKILTMKIYHAVPSLFKGYSCFNHKLVNPWRPEIINTAQKHKKNNLYQVEMSILKTKSVIKPKNDRECRRYVRRMDTYPVGSLNQVILKGYYYDFGLR